MRKQDVQTSDDLKNYLKECVRKSNRLFHFTTLESLLRIIRNKSFRLTRMDLMNDKAEKNLGKLTNHSENYIMSFTQGKEYVSMWAMYGKASGIKLRLDFDSKELISGLKNYCYSCFEKISTIQVDNSNMKKAFCVLSDIVYLDKEKNEFKHKENPFPNFKVNDDKIINMAGFIKYDAWEFEREKRLLVNLKYDYDLEKKKYPKYIFLNIDNNLIKTFHITFNPWISDEMKNVVRESLKKAAGYEIICNNSTNDGEVDEF